MGWWFVWIGVASGACPEPAGVPLSTWGEPLIEAYDALDEERFDQAAERLVSAIACLDRVVAPEEAARVHQWMGWVAFAEGDRARSRASWATARQLDPDWKPDRSRVPIGHPLSEVYAEAGVVTSSEEQLAPNRWWVDGVRSEGVPVARAFVLQKTDPQGEVVFSEYYSGFEQVPLSVNRTSGFRAARHEWTLTGIWGGRRSVQPDSGEVSALGEVDASRWTGGVHSGMRSSLDPHWALEARVSALGATDPAEGGSPELDVAATALRQLTGPVGRERLEVAALFGLSLGQMHAWGWRPDRAVFSWRIPSVHAGVEAGRVAERWRVRGRLTGRLASGWVPHQLAMDGQAALAMAGAWTASFGVQGRTRRLEVWQTDTAAEAMRTDQEWTLRFGVGRTW